jgi:hypothetical protein
MQMLVGIGLALALVALLDLFVEGWVIRRRRGRGGVESRAEQTKQRIQRTTQGRQPIKPIDRR